MQRELDWASGAWPCFEN